MPLQLPLLVLIHAAHPSAVDIHCFTTLRQDCWRRLNMGMERQQRLMSGDLRLWAILDESLLDRPVGGPAVLREQLDHLLRLPSEITIQVVPMQTTWHPGLTGSFTLMSFEEYPEVAFTEAFVSDAVVDAPADVAAYRLMFDQLRAAGQNPKTSQRAIEAARDRIDTGET